MNPTSTIIAGGVGLIVSLALAFMLYVQTDRLEDRTRERDTAIEQRDAANRAIDELAVERARAELRYVLVLASRESILAAPDSEDGNVAPVLWLGLRAADQIGGIE